MKPKTAQAEQRLRQAQDRLDLLFGNGSRNETIQGAFDDVHDAERALATARGEQYARQIDLGVRWDVGAPLPHLLSNGLQTWIVCHTAADNPDWDGTTVRMVSPSDTASSALIVINLERCHDVRIGGPNDEAREGHPLDGRGLVEYSAHEVIDSTWLDEARRRNSVHEHHSDEAFARLHHYVLLFHDEMVEALAHGIGASLKVGTVRTVLTSLVVGLT